MGKKLVDKTPRSRVRNHLRKLWMLSRERNHALKLADRSCKHCGVKASQAKGREQKIEVHHTKGINWEELIDLVYERLLQTPQDYTCLCPDCHLQLHEHEKKK